jgi:hypothetical protein
MMMMVELRRDNYEWFCDFIIKELYIIYTPKGEGGNCEKS